jgi:hypothetical protein
VTKKRRRGEKEVWGEIQCFYATHKSLQFQLRHKSLHFWSLLIFSSSFSSFMSLDQIQKMAANPTKCSDTDTIPNSKGDNEKKRKSQGDDGVDDTDRPYPRKIRKQQKKVDFRDMDDLPQAEYYFEHGKRTW